jgi:hypothetical protein
MDAERRYRTNSSLGVPKHRGEFAILLDDDFSSEAKVSIEPGSPKATSVELNVHLLVATFIS